MYLISFSLLFARSCSSLFYLFIFGFSFSFVFLEHVWCLTFFFNSHYYTSWSFIISFLIFMLHLNHLPLLLHFISLIIKCKELIWLMEFSFYCFSFHFIASLDYWLTISLLEVDLKIHASQWPYKFYSVSSFKVKIHIYLILRVSACMYQHKTENCDM